MLSHDFYVGHPEEFFDFYRTKMIALGARPNQAHRKLAELEKDGPLTAVITQNIDGLHQAAGSRSVLELHGSVHRNVCQACGASSSAEWGARDARRADVPGVRRRRQARRRALRGGT